MLATVFSPPFGEPRPLGAGWNLGCGGGPAKEKPPRDQGGSVLQSLSDVPAARYGSHHQFRPFGAPALCGRFSMRRLYAKRTERANPPGEGEWLSPEWSRRHSVRRCDAQAAPSYVVARPSRYRTVLRALNVGECSTTALRPHQAVTDLNGGLGPRLLLRLRRDHLGYGFRRLRGGGDMVVSHVKTSLVCSRPPSTLTLPREPSRHPSTLRHA